MDLMSNFGAARVTGGLNVLSNIIGKPGKTGIDGSQVQDMYDAGGVQEINDYCVCDVLDTYFVFLRSRVLTGHLSLEQEQQRVAQAKELLEKNQDRAAFAHVQEIMGGRGGLQHRSVLPMWARWTRGPGSDGWALLLQRLLGRL